MAQVPDYYTRRVVRGKRKTMAALLSAHWAEPHMCLSRGGWSARTRSLVYWPFAGVFR